MVGAGLQNLTAEQCRAVEHGIVSAGANIAGPLPVIVEPAQTNTLAHRVAHLIVNGADPVGSCC
jgi:hypothetical protein